MGFFSVAGGEPGTSERIALGFGFELVSAEVNVVHIRRGVVSEALLGLEIVGETIAGEDAIRTFEGDVPGCLDVAGPRVAQHLICRQ